MRTFLGRWPDASGDPGDRLPEYERISEPVRLQWDPRGEDKVAHVCNQGYERDWRTGMWRHPDMPHAWFTLEVLMQLAPPRAARKCSVCGYLTGFGHVCLCCDY